MWQFSKRNIHLKSALSVALLASSFSQIFANTLQQQVDAVVASVAPMIGLLGTVSGMISAFQTIGRGGMGRPELLAGDIGEALITTATGLVIGIPAMIAYFVLKNRLNTAMIATAQAGTEVIEAAEEAQVFGAPQ